VTRAGAKRRTGLRLALAASTTAVAVALAGCSGGAPILANPPAAEPSQALPTATPIPVFDPQPISLPHDDAPHDRLTEWWYYTGHLRAPDDRPFGFEYVIFRAERGFFPISWVSHLAVTDEANQRFLYSQRLEVGAGVDRAAGGSGAAAGFGLAIVGPEPSPPETATRSAWTMSGSDGSDLLDAQLSRDEADRAGVPGGLGLELRLRSMKPAVLHDGNGWIDFGPAGGSYYYSRTAMAAAGSLTIDGMETTVEGTAWFDHQWGDFISVGGGGWDWFAVNLEDGTDLTLSLVRGADGSYPLIYGTIVAPGGTSEHLDRDAFSVTSTASWTSPATGAVYPAAWRVEVPGERLTIEMVPTVADQELDTRATTGVVYWEGSQVVRATRDGTPLRGEAYVELTGYAPSGLVSP
jgi:predicted secreted hydrolase